MQRDKSGGLLADHNVKEYHFYRDFVKEEDEGRREFTVGESIAKQIYGSPPTKIKLRN